MSAESSFRPDLFEGRTVLVTGAAGGIGAGIAEAFAAHGAFVCLQDVRADEASARAGILRDKGLRADAVGGDLARKGAAGDIFEAAMARLGRVDVLVNNAGRSWAVETVDIDPARAEELNELNLMSVLWLSQRFIAHALERGGGGSILQVSSTAGVAGFQRRAVYCATKHGVIGLTRVMALDHARDGVRVNAILPHVVETDMFRTVASKADGDSWRAAIPAQRFASVDDVSNLALFLCSPAASYLTGGCYPVDGGAMAGPYGG
ncbi:MAG TPA: SDR family oxidoreductase [Alphaproteobacteria bacterium]|nr:SDR family oxidoreductase [Alphaproteobacteria bacterium]